jgi:hypothetical protein
MRVDDIFTRFLDTISNYLPSVAAGLLLILIGLAAAWFSKRLVIQILIVLRFHRILAGFRWAKGLLQVDVRLSLYRLIGNLCGFVIFLVFLNAAFAALKLTMVSELVEKLVLLFPRILAAILIFGFGWAISSWAGHAIRRTLQRESVPRPSLIAGYARFMLLLLFAGMGLAEIDLAPRVVLIGFTVVYATLGAVTIALAVLGGRKILDTLFTRSEKEDL